MITKAVYAVLRELIILLQQQSPILNNIMTDCKIKET